MIYRVMIRSRVGRGRSRHSGRLTGYGKLRRNMVKKVPRLRDQGTGWILRDGKEALLKDVWEGKREIR